MTPKFLDRSKTPKFLRRSKTPLKIRNTIFRRTSCPQTGKLLLRLVWPVPWYLQPPSQQLSFTELRTGGESTLDFRQIGIYQLHEIPLFRGRDTSLAALYRLYEDLSCGQLIWMSYECEYFFFHPERRWRLDQIPDPKDPDPLRSALLASMVEALVDAFNWRLELGIGRDRRFKKDFVVEREVGLEPERCPAWTSSIAPLEKTLKLNTGEDGKELGNPHPAFLKRSIEAPMGYLYTV